MGNKQLTTEQLAQFGRGVLEIMDSEEWSSDTLQAIGDFAYFQFGYVFDEPEGDT